MRKPALLGWLTIGSLLFVAGAVSAQAKQRVVTISEVTIVGRVQKPIAAVDVSRIQPKLTLGSKKQPFVERIEKAIQDSPF